MNHNHWPAYFKYKTIKENFLKDQLRYYYVNRIWSYTQRSKNCEPGSRNNIWRENVLKKKNEYKINLMVGWTLQIHQIEHQL